MLREIWEANPDAPTVTINPNTHTGPIQLLPPPRINAPLVSLPRNYIAQDLDMAVDPTHDPAPNGAGLTHYEFIQDTFERMFETMTGESIHGNSDIDDAVTVRAEDAISTPSTMASRSSSTGLRATVARLQDEVKNQNEYINRYEHALQLRNERIDALEKEATELRKQMLAGGLKDLIRKLDLPTCGIRKMGFNEFGMALDSRRYNLFLKRRLISITNLFYESLNDEYKVGVAIHFRHRLRTGISKKFIFSQTLAVTFLKDSVGFISCVEYISWFWKY